MRRAAIAATLSLAFVCTVCRAGDVPLPEIDPRLAAELGAYLTEHGQSPVDYVVDKFADHDVVFLGEHHYIKHDLALVHELIPRLYAAGVYYLGTEFSRHEEQPMIDSLLAMDTYDEALAREIMFREQPDWGYQDYVDVYLAAWELNHSLPPDAPRFHILGLNGSPRWYLMKTREDQNSEEMKRAVWKGETEDTWAKWILEQVNAGQKVMVHCGIHHAFTEYRQPVLAGDGTFIRHTSERAGNAVYDAIGKRAVTVSLHFAWPDATGRSDMTYPVQGTIDALMQWMGPDAYPVAFDTKGTPFGRLAAPGSYYAAGYDDFRLDMFCDGYIFTRPLGEYEGVTVIMDFVNKQNLARAQRNSPSVQFRDAPVEKFILSMVMTAGLGAYQKFH